MAAVRAGTMGTRPEHRKERLPLARQIQDFEPQTAQSHTEETRWPLLCETLCPLWLRFLCPATTQGSCFLSRLQSPIRRALPARPATAEARLDRVPQSRAH